MQGGVWSSGLSCFCNWVGGNGAFDVFLAEIFSEFLMGIDLFGIL